MRKKRKRLEAAEGLSGDMEYDDNSQMSDIYVTVVETATGKKLKGEERPLMSQLNSWLESHPGWEVVDYSDDSDDSDDDNQSRDSSIKSE